MKLKNFKLFPEIFFYLFFYMALFAQYPLKGWLPGNTDTLLAISLSNLFAEKMQLIFHGMPSFTVSYPQSNFLAYGENCYGLGIFFYCFKLIFRSDILAYYIYISALFALSSFSLFKLIGLFVRDHAVALMAGLAFPLAGFTLANIDDSNVVFVFFPVMGIYFLERSVRESSRRFLLYGLALSGFQIWFGFYIFTFQFLFILIFLCWNLLRISTLIRAVDVLALSLAYLLPCLPLLLLYVHNRSQEQVFFAYNNHFLFKATSIHWYNFRNVLPHNLLYSSKHNIIGPLDRSEWLRIRGYCFPGVIFPLIAAWGITCSKIKNHFLLASLVIFLTLSTGYSVPQLEHLLTIIPYGEFLRIPSRIYLFFLIVLVVYFAMGIEDLLSRYGFLGKKIGTALLCAVAAIFIIENVPFPLPGYELKSIITPPKSYGRFFDKFSERQIVLDLPSTYKFVLPDDVPLYSYNRDIIYMNWQSYHKQIILNGVNSYIPESRKFTDDFVQGFPSGSWLTFREPLKNIGLKYILFHKNMVLNANENILAKLKQYPQLRLKFEDDVLAIFELVWLD